MRRPPFLSRFRRGPSRSFRPRVLGLEARELLTTWLSKLAATPSVLNPPNNRFVAVEVTGTVVETGTRIIPNVVYHVTDEYRRIEPSGPVTLTAESSTTYSFKFTVVLQAKRSNEDHSGRLYAVIVGTNDHDGGQGLVVPVLVPHNKLKPGQTILPYRVKHPSLPFKKLPPLSGNTHSSPTSGLPSLGTLFGKK